jgi:hypothetical protein
MRTLYYYANIEIMCIIMDICFLNIFFPAIRRLRTGVDGTCGYYCNMPFIDLRRDL